MDALRELRLKKYFEFIIRCNDDANLAYLIAKEYIDLTNINKKYYLIALKFISYAINVVNKNNHVQKMYCAERMNICKNIIDNKVPLSETVYQTIDVQKWTLKNVSQIFEQINNIKYDSDSIPNDEQYVNYICTIYNHDKNIVNEYINKKFNTINDILYWKMCFDFLCETKNLEFN